MSGDFVLGGEFRIAPVDTGPASAEPTAFTRLHLQCLDTAYERIIGEGFGRRLRAEADDVAAEDRAYLARPGTRAAIAWANPGFGTSNEFGCCSIGADPDLWFRPVGLALSAEGPQPWEAQVGAQPLRGAEGKPPRTLVTLYVLPEAQGRGLGGALLDAVLDPEEPAYLWIINGNDGAERFYARRGFRSLHEAFPGDGAWAPATTGRLVRGLEGPSGPISPAEAPGR